ncbi:hypothetical protein [uncultured Slackia sp.]|uniref:hypothetical protein n=1 Tax=uncultured Slackia sp. TaxID=665903 RepID=UPI0025DF14BC|nr:hypothetical protein [uncultured Slackia sp.]
MDGTASKRGVAQRRGSVVEERGSSINGQWSTSETRLYERWLSVLCAGMAVFGIGVMFVGYKAPTVGLVATVVMLVAASALLAMKAKRNMRK